MGAQQQLRLTVEFPYGDASSLCQFIGEQSHPLYGNGLLIVQRFPHPMPAGDGGRARPDFSQADLARLRPATGSAATSTRRMICFNGFIPNALLQAGLLPGLYYSCAAGHRRCLRDCWGGNGMRIRSPLDHSAAGRASRGGPEPGLMPVSSPGPRWPLGLGPPPLGPPPFGSTAVWVHRRLGPPLLPPEATAIPHCRYKAGRAQYVGRPGLGRP